MASYLVLDMGVDWRLGADWFETVLQDYDVCSNWGNWVAAAGFTGGRINHFNIAKQSKVSCLPIHGLCFGWMLMYSIIMSSVPVLAGVSGVECCNVCCNAHAAFLDHGVLSPGPPPSKTVTCRIMTSMVSTSEPGFQS